MDKGLKIVKTALKEVGYTEYPSNSNKTKYGKWFGFDSVPWCGMFVSWVYYISGFPLGNIGFLKGFAGCQTAVAHFKKKKEVVSFKNASAGDIVFFDWNNDGRYDHTGILIQKMGYNKIKLVEGNTSAWNQSNGGEVQIRERDYKKCNCIFVHPKVLDK